MVKYKIPTDRVQLANVRLSTSLDLELPLRRYRAHGRTQVANLLEDDALETVNEAVAGVPKWALVTYLGNRHVTLDAAEMAVIDIPRRRQFYAMVTDAARTGFQYLYEVYSLYGKWHAGTLQREAPDLARLFEFLNGEEFLGAMRRLVGVDEISFVDAQLTRYRAGHFLTAHDDSVDKGNRIAAYVLGLTRSWQPDWGGQLQFFGNDGAVQASWVPRMNVLSVFRVPQRHAVTYVPPWVPRDRISITGWFRAGADPGPAGVG